MADLMELGASKVVVVVLLDVAVVRGSDLAPEINERLNAAKMNDKCENERETKCCSNE
jgi:hypothetical protein